MSPLIAKCPLIVDGPLSVQLIQCLASRMTQVTTTGVEYDSSTSEAISNLCVHMEELNYEIF